MSSNSRFPSAASGLTEQLEDLDSLLATALSQCEVGDAHGALAPHHPSSSRRRVRDRRLRRKRKEGAVEKQHPGEHVEEEPDSASLPTVSVDAKTALRLHDEVLPVAKQLLSHVEKQPFDNADSDEENTVSVYPCQRCHITFYCSVLCRAAHARVHARSCQKQKRYDLELYKKVVESASKGSKICAYIFCK